MPNPHRITIALTTDSSGDVTGYSEAINGLVSHLIYTKDDFADGVDFAITGEESGTNIWTESNVNAAKTVAPRQATHSEAGVASLYASAGEPVEDHIVIANERIKVVIAQGGNVTNGTISIILV